MRILVTGSSGQLGAVICSMISGEHSIVGVDSAPGVLLRHFPNIEEVFAKKGWSLPKSIDGVYSIEKAKEFLDYCPQFNFDTLIDTK